MSTVKTKVGAKEHARTTTVAVQAALPLLDPDVQRSLENLATQIEAILDILPVGTGVDNTVPRFVGTSGLIEPTALVISDTNFLSGAAGVGIGGASAVATNRLSANTPAVLFNRETDDIQVKLNKEAAGDTASFLFQTAFSGRAEIGTVANDDFVFKTSPDGSAFNSGLTVRGADAGVRVHVNIAPNANDGAPLGLSGTAFSDLFLASGAVINFNAGDVTLTHAANALAFAGASSGYTFDATIRPAANDGAALGVSGTAWSDLFLASGAVINFNAGDVTVTHSANALAFAGAATAYTFADGPVQPAVNDGGALGVSGTAWSDLFLASGAVINFNAGDVTVTHAANTLAFAGATSGYTFADGPVRPATNDGAALGAATVSWADLFLAEGAVTNWSDGNVTLTQSATMLTINSVGQTVLALTSVPTAGAGNCGIELGRVDGTGSTPFFDFHSGATAVDYDSRLIASGGTGANGGGTLEIEAAVFGPRANDATRLGTASRSWSDLFLASGAVINYANGNYTVTHSAGLLTFSGGITASAGTVTLGTVAGTIDMGGATSLEVPNNAAPTVNANGEIAIDTSVADFSHGIMKYFSGEEMAVVALPIAELTTPTNGDVVTYNATNDEFELAPQGGVDANALAKFWVRADVAGGVPSLTDSFNVTSISDVATGQLGVTIATDFANANWCCLVTIEFQTGEPSGMASNIGTGSLAAGSVTAYNKQTGASANAGFDDPNSWHVIGFGDQ